ncbi:MAG TPA: hypothetical protein V6C65_33065 [Allocoleopsis sp.]
MTTLEQRVSALEAQMQEIQATLAQVAQLQLQGQQQLNQLELAQQATQRQIDQTQAQIQQQSDELDQECEFLVGSIGRLERQISELGQHMDASVRQADLDRQLFTQAVDRMIDILTAQFGRNGHQEG